MKNKYVLIIVSLTALTLGSLGFYYYKKMKTRLEYEKSIKQITTQYNVFN